MKQILSNLFVYVAIFSLMLFVVYAAQPAVEIVSTANVPEFTTVTFGIAIVAASLGLVLIRKK